MLETEFERVWPKLEAAVAEEVGGAGFSKEAILRALLSGELILWTSDNSAALTETNVQETRKTLHIWVAGGKLKELLGDIYPRIEEFARLNGFQYVTASGRDAWARVCRGIGFAPVYTTFAKEMK